MLLALWVRAWGGWYRYRDRTRSGPLRKFHTMLYKAFMDSRGAYISLLADFAGEPRLPHKQHGIFIAPSSRIGARVTIYQQVTIGKNDTESSPRFGAPRIADDVYIGAGAKIIGRIEIGSGARIGAGAVVVTDVAPGVTVVSPKALAVE